MDDTIHVIDLDVAPPPAEQGPRHFTMRATIHLNRQPDGQDGLRAEDFPPRWWPAENPDEAE